MEVARKGIDILALVGPKERRVNAIEVKLVKVALQGGSGMHKKTETIETFKERHAMQRV